MEKTQKEKLLESYKLLLSRLDSKSTICMQMSLMVADETLKYDDYKAMYRDFHSRKPMIFSKSWWSDHYVCRFTKFGFWWTMDKYGHLEREVFIKKIIKKLEKLN